jgi:glycosyltransferase involved in cell wall biosynthesis
LCTGNVGACDDLLRAGRNGYVIEPDNAEGLARLMERLAADEGEWRRLCEGSLALAPRADVARFADAVAYLVGLRSAPSP